MTEFYSPGQLSVIYPFLGDFVPKWLLLGGPADANEAQTAREKWPDIQIIGVEPNRDAIAFQKASGWPKDAPLLCGTLDSGTGFRNHIVNETGSLRHQRVTQEALSEPSARLSISLCWEDLDCWFGPFEDAILWMDIEGSEWVALLGASEVLRRGGIKLINVEMQPQSGQCLAIESFMDNHGFKAVHEWNKSPLCWDRIYVR